MLALAALIGLAGCGRLAKQSKLIGSWEVVGMPQSKRLIYTFDADGTLAVGGPIRERCLYDRGRWEIRGMLLILTTTTNIHGEPIVPPLTSRVTISELSDSVLILKAVPISRGFRLRRVERPPGLGEGQTNKVTK